MLLLGQSGCRGLVPAVNIEGQENSQDIGGHLGPDDAEHAEDGIQKEKHGDVEAQPPGHA